MHCTAACAVLSFLLYSLYSLYSLCLLDSLHLPYILCLPVPALLLYSDYAYHAYCADRTYLCYARQELIKKIAATDDSDEPQGQTEASSELEVSLNTGHSIPVHSAE